LGCLTLGLFDAKTVRLLEGVEGSCGRGGHFSRSPSPRHEVVDNTAWKLAKQVFHDALQETGRERMKFVDEACGDDVELLAQVNALLQAHEEAGDFLSEGSLASALLESVALLDAAGSGDLPGVAPGGAEGGEGSVGGLGPGGPVGGECSVGGRDGVGGEAPPDRIGPYEILGVLGVGGMGTVYRARDPDLSRDLAIKVLPDDLVSSTQLARFEREAKLLASLNHPNIATIHTIGETGGRPFLVLELIEGESLSQRLTGGPLAVEKAVDIGRQVAEAMGAAHEAGIVHRDLKPANVMITTRGLVKILDFGIAKAAGSGTPAADRMKVTGDGTLVGTIPYMSPEQIGGGEVDERSDLWALGCLLFEILTGASPFQRSTSALTLVAIQKEAPDLAALPGGTPEALKEMIAGCLDKDPERRPASANVVRALLSDTLTGLRGPPAGAWSRMTPMGRAAWVAVGVLTTIAVLTVAEVSFVRTIIDSLPPKLRIGVTDGGRLAAVALAVLLLGFRVLMGGGPGQTRRRIRIAGIGLVAAVGLALLYPLGTWMKDTTQLLFFGGTDVYVSLPFQGADNEDADELLSISRSFRSTLEEVFSDVEAITIMPLDYDEEVLGHFPPQCNFQRVEVWLVGSGLSPDLVLCNKVNVFPDSAEGKGLRVVSSLRRAHDQVLEPVVSIESLGGADEVRYLALWAGAQMVWTLREEQILLLPYEDEEAILRRILDEFSMFLMLQGDAASEVARVVEGLRDDGPGEGRSRVQEVIGVLADYEPAVSLEEDGARHKRTRDAILQRFGGSK
jgi:hypothetical protein